MDTDVVILGGGPVGCLLAVLLDDLGVANALVERDLEPYQLPRAIVMDDEIQRVFHDHRLGEWLTSHTSPLEAADFTHPDGTSILGLAMPALGPFGLPPVVTHYQPELDAMLRAEATGRGTVTRFGRTAMSILDNGTGVTTVLDDGETIRSRWFVGCDGASSWTRRTLGLTLEDLRFDQQWLVVDVELLPGRSPVLPVGVRQYCDPVRPTTYVKGHGAYRRWEFQIQPDDDPTELDRPDGLWRLLAPWLTSDDARLIRSAVYRFHAVVAPQMRRGNVFLAGDAAHQTPPFLGQGLNSGMRDAVNLAWKLALCRRGVGGAALLDTYSSERVPHVHSVVAHAVDLGRLIDQLAGRQSHGIEHGAGYGGARPQPRLGPGVVAGDDEHVGRPLRHHPAVTAAAAGGSRFVLVTATATALPPILARWGAVEVVDASIVGDAVAILVRPDGYVAAVARSDDELATIMSAWAVLADPG